MTKPVLILGVGNLLMWDEGIGVHVVNSIIESGMEIPERVEVIDGGTAGYDLLPLMQDREKIIIVDALKANDQPGSIYRFRPEQLLESRQIHSMHEVGMKRIIDMLHIMGERPEIEIIGIVPQDISTFDIGISSSVRDSIPRAVEQIFDAATH